MRTQVIEAIVLLVLILPLIWGVVYLLKHWYLPGHEGDSSVQIVRQIPLGGKEKIVIIRVEDVELIIGVTPHSFNTLHVMTKNAKS